MAVAQISRRRAEPLFESAVEGRQTIEAPGKGDIPNGAAFAEGISKRGAAFVESPGQHVLSEACTGRLKQQMQLPHRDIQRCGDAHWG